MEYKTTQGQILDVDEDEGIITALFAVFGAVDMGMDRIWPGSFSKTFVERGHKVLILDQHKTDSIGNTIAKPISLREVTREELPPDLILQYPEATGAAEVVAQFDLEDDISARCFRRIKNKWVTEWSFGYDALDIDFTKEVLNGEDVTVRNLRTLRLYEVSSCLWGMQPATTTTGAKSLEGKPWDIFEQDEEYCVYRIDEDGNQMGDSLGCHPTRQEAQEQIQALYVSEEDAQDKQDTYDCECLDCGHTFMSEEHCDEATCPECKSTNCRREERLGMGKGATGKAGLPLASRDREWDAGTAESRVRSWAGGEEDTDWSKYRQAFFWYDSDNPDQFGSYKLQFADIVGGELQAVPRGIFAVAAVLQGARGGVDIPATDQSKIKSKVNSYYASMQSEFDDDSIVPPWEKSKSTNLSEIVADVRSAFNTQYNPTNGPWTYWVSTVYDDIVIIEHESESGTTHYSVAYVITDDSITFAPRGEWIEGSLEFAPKGIMTKIGRVLARRNSDRLVGALQTILDVLEDAGIDIPGYNSEPVVEEEDEKFLRSIELEPDATLVVLIKENVPHVEMERVLEKFRGIYPNNEVVCLRGDIDFRVIKELGREEAGPVSPPTSRDRLLEIELELLELAMEG